MRKKKYLVSPERVEERSRADNEYYKNLALIEKEEKEAKAPTSRLMQDNKK